MIRLSYPTHHENLRKWRHELRAANKAYDSVLRTMDTACEEDGPTMAKVPLAYAKARKIVAQAEYDAALESYNNAVSYHYESRVPIGVETAFLFVSFDGKTVTALS